MAHAEDAPRPKRRLSLSARMMGHFVSARGYPATGRHVKVPADLAALRWLLTCEWCGAGPVDGHAHADGCRGDDPAVYTAPIARALGART